ncbi:MAG: hypothetical protein AB7T49_17260 [Oligoflexales bacterium]
MKRFLLIAILAVSTSYFALKKLTVRDDIVDSLSSSNSEAREVFANYVKASSLTKKVFLDLSGASPDERSTLLDKMKSSGYVEVTRDIPMPDLGFVVGMMTRDEIAEQLAAKPMQGSLVQIKKLLTLPGSGALLKHALEDPLGLREKFLTKNLPSQANVQVLQFERPGELVFDRVGELYSYLASLGNKVRWIGADFFAYENYKTLRRDITLCATVSTIFGLLVFFLFCRQARLLLFLLIGTWLSYGTGLALVGSFYDHTYGLVLAFTSTFLGYNNEYLIHLSGIPKDKRMQTAIGLGSAIGTTLIGFLVLLLSESEIIRQIAVMSIGGMVGFIALMLIFQDKVSTVSFRPVRIPKLAIGMPTLFGLVAACVAGLAFMWPLDFRTDINDFRYASSLLTSQEEFFNKQLQKVAMGDFFAVKAHESLLEEYDQVSGEIGFHPMKFFANADEQSHRLQTYNRGMEKIAPLWRKELENLGLSPNVRLELPDVPRDEENYLSTWGELSGIPWFTSVGTAKYLFAPFQSGAKALQNNQEIFPLHPRTYYNLVLTEIQHGASLLFLAGLGVMVLYLLPLQRRLSNVFYIIAPLFPAALIVGLLLRASGTSINFIHVAGCALVIALALDYSAISVSTDHNQIDDTKILLTGTTTIAMFGALLLARHPVLRALGLVVTSGAAVSMLFALMTKLKRQEST